MTLIAICTSLHPYQVRAQDYSTPYTFTTLAGSGDTSFSAPTGVAVDSSGNVYVADSGNNKIRKITPSGIVSTLAGSGAKGSTDGYRTNASFFYPRSVAVDARGIVYVADTSNSKIRKISPEGVVSTLAGSGEWGSTDGTGSNARFSNPSGIAVDAIGYVYVADSYNDKIRKISPEGIVSTLAGSGEGGNSDGLSTVASFRNPTGIAVDASGNVYVGDSDNDIIRKISPTRVVSTLAGHRSYEYFDYDQKKYVFFRGYGNTDGTGRNARFSNPTGVAVDAGGNVYVQTVVTAIYERESPFPLKGSPSGH